MHCRRVRRRRVVGTSTITTAASSPRKLMRWWFSATIHGEPGCTMRTSTPCCKPISARRTTISRQPSMALTRPSSPAARNSRGTEGFTAMPCEDVETDRCNWCVKCRPVVGFSCQTKPILHAGRGASGGFSDAERAASAHKLILSLSIVSRLYPTTAILTTSPQKITRSSPKYHPLVNVSPRPPTT